MFTPTTVEVFLLYYIKFKNHVCMSGGLWEVSLFCWVSNIQRVPWVGGVVCVFEATTSACGNGLKHYFNYKSVTSLLFTEIQCNLFLCVFLYLGGTHCLPDPRLQPPRWEQKGSNSILQLFFFFSSAVWLNKAESGLVWVFTPHAPSSSHPQTCCDF